MKQNFPKALTLVLKHEGGYVNHPRDPGGATNKGITWRTYNAYRARKGQEPRDVRNITDAEVSAIYKVQYWDVVKADDLPSGLDYVVFDFAVNSGPSRSVQFLQRIVGVEADGVMGQITLAAVKERDPEALIAALCDNRLAWLKRLKTWGTFGKGWTRRVTEAKATGLAMAKGSTFEAASQPAPGKAAGEEKATATVSDMLKDPKAWTAAGGAIGSVSAVANGDGPVQFAIAGVLILAALVGIYFLVRSRK